MWITFSACAAESEDLTSDSTPDFEQLAESLAQSAWWRGKHSPARSWARRCKKGGWMRVLSGAAISPSSQPPTFPVSTGTPAATLALPTVSPGSDLVRTIGDTCGPSSPDTLTFFDQEECFLRTWPDTSHSVSVMCLQTWKDLVSDVRSASTQRRKLVRHIAESESLSSGWATPTQADADKATPRSTMGRCLAREAVIGTTAGRAEPEMHKKTGSHRVLSPLWVEALMGFPIGWTDCER